MSELDRQIQFIEWFNNLKTFDQNDKISILSESNLMYKNLRNKLYKRFIKEKYKKKSYLYLTLSPDKLLRNIECSKENLAELDRWAHNWFKFNKKHYGPDWCYVVEVGSNGDHAHIHALVEIINSHKHAEQLKASWKKTFPNNQLLTSKNLGIKNNSRGEYCYLRIDRQDILEDKLNYFINDYKATHVNLFDPGLTGSGGLFTDKLRDL